MKHSLRTKLTISYIFITLIAVGVLSFASNFLLDRQFQNYIIKQQKQANQGLADLIGKQYDDKSNSWDKSVIENLGVNALEQGLIIKVIDNSSNIIWDATKHNSGLCLQMLNHMSKNMSERYPGFNGSYVESQYKLTHNFKEVGTIDIGYYGPFFFSDNDLAFINTLNKILIIVGAFSIFLSLVLGTIMAKRISMPILRTVQTARQIAKGYFGGRIGEKSRTLEIEQLTSTINNLAETLEKQETLRKQLTSDVAHELRTPLATLQSHMEAMIDGIWKPDRERLENCHEEIMRLGRMVGDLEKLAKIEDENLILNKTSFDLAALLRHIAKSFESEAVKKGVFIKLDNVEKEKLITADRDKISQVLTNLISNAIKYTERDGSVEIKITDKELYTAVSVADTGIGIAEDDLPFIFERFYRVDKSRNRLTGGSGIGLTIVKAIVEAHRGKINVESELGKGSVFEIMLPAQQ